MDFTLSTLGLIGDASSASSSIMLTVSPTLAGGRRRRLSLCSTLASCRATFTNNEGGGTNDDDDGALSGGLDQPPLRKSSLCSGLFEKEESASASKSSGGSSIDTHLDSFLVYLGRSLPVSPLSTRRGGGSDRKKLFSSGEDDDDDDDDTASTVSTATATSVDEDDSSCNGSVSSERASSSGRPARGVQFCDPLVTAVYTRPLTTSQDKYYLHYNEHDYVDFKLDYLYGGTGRRSTPSNYYYKRTVRRVQFERDVVTTVHPVLDAKQRQNCDLYYSERELQTFLDDFVASLSSFSKR